MQDTQKTSFGGKRLAHLFVPIDKSALFAAIIIAIADSVSTTMLQTHELSSIIVPEYLGHAISRFLLYGSLFYILLKSAFSYFDNSETLSASETARSGGMPSITHDAKTRSFFFKTFAAIFICWLPWLIFHMGGTIRDDTIPQIMQWDGMIGYYTQHPVFDTLIFGVFTEIGKLIGGNAATGLWILCFTQAAFLSLALAYMFSYLRENNVPRIVILTGILIVCLSRAAYQPADAVSKDTINALFFVIIATLFMECVRTRSAWLANVKRVALVAIIVVLCVITKRTMMYVLLGMAIILFAQASVRGKSLRNSMSIVVAMVIPTLIASSIVMPALARSVGADNNKTYEMYSIPVQQVVRTELKRPDKIPDDVRDEISRFIDLSEAAKDYNPSRSDEATAHIRNDCTTEDKIAFFSAYARIGVKAPALYIGAFADLTAGWFSFDNELSYSHSLYDDTLKRSSLMFWSKAFFDGNMSDARTYLEETYSYTEPVVLETGRNALEELDMHQSQVRILSSYGLFCFAIPFSIVLWCVTRKRVAALATCTPAIMLFASFMMCPIALYWYSIPIVFITPMIIAIPTLYRGKRANASTT